MTGMIPVCQCDWRRERVMMGPRSQGQRHLFYEFHLVEVVPDDHLVRKVDAVLDLSWVHAELAPHYSRVGRPSIDPVLMIRMLIVGYVFAIRSERQLCREVQVNLAYRRFFCPRHENPDPPPPPPFPARPRALPPDPHLLRALSPPVGGALVGGPVRGQRCLVAGP